MGDRVKFVLFTITCILYINQENKTLPVALTLGNTSSYIQKIVISLTYITVIDIDLCYVVILYQPRAYYSISYYFLCIQNGLSHFYVQVITYDDVQYV